MLRMNRFFVILVLLLAFALTSAAQEPVTVRFTQWIPVDSDRSATFLAIAEEYMAANPGVTVQFEFIPFADYNTTLPLQLSGTNPPDAGWLTENVAPTWLQSGILADMGAALTSDAEYDYADLAPSGMGLWLAGDGVYGVPFSTSPFLLIYNRDLFAAAGVDAPDAMLEKGEYTWDNLAAAMKAIREETGVAGLQSINGALYSGERVWHTVIPFIWAYGGDAWDADNNCLLNSPESVAGVQKFHDMIFVDRGVEAPGEVVDFYTGTAAVLMGQLSRVGPLADASFGWDIAPLPEGPAGKVDVIGQAAIVVFNNSPNRDIAIDFVKFLTNKENTLKIAEFFPPIRASALATDVLYTANPTISAESMKTAVIDPTLTGRVLPAHPNFPTIDLTSRTYWDQLWVADANIQAIMDEMCAAIQPLLNR
ncbi:MAG: sugar ABC transporter substrate-binding protein [Chloroflexi bacterium]|nr:sugar ABC transporter substrate-binding protein [Chloroflexota bacterium]